mgnify:CR=1 FL=1
MAIRKMGIVEAVVLVDGDMAIGKRFLAHHDASAIRIYDLQEGEVNSYATLRQNNAPLQWSVDGNWLLVADDGLLHLIEAETGTEAVIEHGLMGCETAVFVEDRIRD